MPPPHRKSCRTRPLSPTRQAQLEHVRHDTRSACGRVAFEKRGGNLRALQIARYRDEKVGLPNCPNADTARREECYGGADCAEGGGSGHDGLYAEVVVKSSSQRLTQSFPRIMLRLAVLLSAGGF